MRSVSSEWACSMSEVKTSMRDFSEESHDVREDFWVWMVVRKDVVKVAGTAAAAILSFDG